MLDCKPDGFAVVAALADAIMGALSKAAAVVATSRIKLFPPNTPERYPKLNLLNISSFWITEVYVQISTSLEKTTQRPAYRTSEMVSRLNHKHHM
jgi:hypothetical protein